MGKLKTNRLLKLSKEIAEEVRDVINSFIDSEDIGNIVYIGADNTPTKKIDDIAEKKTFELLKEAEIPILVVSEEAGAVALDENPEYICLLDPLDGTDNAVKGIPIYSFSIAFARYSENAILGDVQTGLVNNISTGEQFQAAKGKKAWKDGRTIKSSSIIELEESTFSVYLQRRDIERRTNLLRGFKKIRSLGSVALELCYVASGAYGGIVDLRDMLRVVDVAAGKLIVEESGGIVTGEDGNKLTTNILGLNRTSIIACGNRELHKKVMESL